MPNQTGQQRVPHADPEAVCPGAPADTRTATAVAGMRTLRAAGM